MESRTCNTYEGAVKQYFLEHIQTDTLCPEPVVQFMYGGEGRGKEVVDREVYQRWCDMYGVVFGGGQPSSASAGGGGSESTAGMGDEVIRSKLKAAEEKYRELIRSHFHSRKEGQNEDFMWNADLRAAHEGAVEEVKTWITRECCKWKDKERNRLRKLVKVSLIWDMRWIDKVNFQRKVGHAETICSRILSGFERKFKGRVCGDASSPDQEKIKKIFGRMSLKCVMDLKEQIAKVELNRGSWDKLVEGLKTKMEDVMKEVVSGAALEESMNDSGTVLELSDDSDGIGEFVEAQIVTLKSEDEPHAEERNDAVYTLRKLLGERFPLREEESTVFYEDNVIQLTAEVKIMDIVNELKEKISRENGGDVKWRVQSLKNVLNSVVTAYVNRNKVQMEIAEKYMATIVDKLGREFVSRMEGHLKENRFVECEALRKICETEKAAVMKSYEEVRKKSKDERYYYRLKEDLEALYVKLESSHLLQMRSLKEDVVAWIQRRCEEYKGELGETLGSVSELEAQHKQHVPSILAEFREEVNLFSESSSMWIELNRKINKDLEGVFEAVKQVQCQTTLLINDCHNKYQTLMKEKMTQKLNDSELKRYHNLSLEEVIKSFNDRCRIRYSDSRHEKYVETLKRTIEETFDELKDMFDWKRSGEEAVAKVILVDATKYYREEMDKHIKNDAFMIPMELERYHVIACQSAIRNCEVATPLTEFHKIKLEEELGTLLQSYTTKNDMNLNCDLGNTPAIGIDLGTTYCCVAVYWKGEVIIIPNHEQGGSPTTPSYVVFNEHGSETVGHPAKDNAYRNPENTIYDAKRIIGRKMSDEHLQNDMKFWPFTVVEGVEDGIPKISTYSKLYHPEEVSAKLLIKMKEMAEKHLKMKPGTIKKAVITVPAYFNDGQRQATMDAGKLAGFKQVLEILNEPTAAAMAYIVERQDSCARKVLIFDLGGGTFDVAVLDVKLGEIDVLGVGGDTHLGGEDFDKNLMEYCATQFKAEYGIELLEGKNSKGKQEKDEVQRRLSRLLTYCEKAKRDLSTARTTEVSVDALVDGLDLCVKVTREKFEELNAGLFEKTIEIVDGVLKDVKVKKEQFDDIVLIGGSTRIPKIQEMLKDYFNEKAMTYSINPDEAVAYGAAVKAAILNGEQLKGKIDFSKIQDVTCMSLGVRTMNPITKQHEYSVIIPKNTKLPAKTERKYVTVKDDQTAVEIVVYQGDAVLLTDNEMLGKFVLQGIPKGKAREQIITKSIYVNSMGILQVEATCISNGVKNGITIVSDKQRMSEETIRRLLEESASRAQGIEKAPAARAAGLKPILRKRVRRSSPAPSFLLTSTSSEDECDLERANEKRKSVKAKRNFKMPKRACRRERKSSDSSDSVIIID